MKVLYAEDERSLADAISTILEIEEFEVDNAYDGEQAYDLLMKNDYDVAILDIMMPKLDGVEVLNLIRKNNNFVPVIMLTAKTTTEDRVLGLTSGADDYLCKPFEAKELIARLNSLVRRTSPKYKKRILEFGQVALDCDKKQINGTNGSLIISQLECDLLSLFIRNHEKELTTDYIIEQVFDDDKNYDALQLYITYLKDKLNHLCVNVQIIENDCSYILKFKDGK